MLCAGGGKEGKPFANENKEEEEEDEHEEEKGEEEEEEAMAAVLGLATGAGGFGG